MSDSLRHFLEIAGIAVVILTLLGALFFGLNKATGFADQVFGKMDGMTQTIDESDYTKYEGAIVTGSEVIAAIKYFQASTEPICVECMGQVYVYQEDLTTLSTANIANATRKGQTGYINPNAKFVGTLTRDSVDNSIRKITFDIYTGAPTP